MTFEQDIRRLGADLVGFADVSCLPAEVRGGLTRAVSIAVGAGSGCDPRYQGRPDAEYFAEYERANTLLAQLSAQEAARPAKRRDTGLRPSADDGADRQGDAVRKTPAQNRRHPGRAGLDRQVGLAGHEGVRVGRATRLRS